MPPIGTPNDFVPQQPTPSTPEKGSKRLKTVLITLLAGGALIFLTIYTFGFSSSDLQKASLTNNTENSTPLASKENIEFSKVIEVSQKNTPGAYIASTNEGKSFWTANGKLAYIVTYFSSGEQALFYEGSSGFLYGKELYSTKDLLYGVPTITDKLAYYTSGKEHKFFYGDKVYDYQGTFFDAISVGGKLALLTSQALSYDGVIIQNNGENILSISKITDIDGKLAYIVEKSSKDNGGCSPGTETLMLDGKAVATGNIFSGAGLVDYNGLPAYVMTDNDCKYFWVASDDKVLSGKYDLVNSLGVIGGKLVFLAKKGTNDNGVLFKLIFDGKEYGNEYDSVWWYVDNGGQPAYIAVNYDQDGENIENSFLVRNGQVLFEGKAGSEIRQKGQGVLDVNGALAVSDGLSFWYGGKTYLDGLNVLNMLNVNGKLAVLTSNYPSQNIFLEQLAQGNQETAQSPRNTSQSAPTVSGQYRTIVLHHYTGTVGAEYQSTEQQILSVPKIADATLKLLFATYLPALKSEYISVSLANGIATVNFKQGAHAYFDQASAGVSAEYVNSIRKTLLQFSTITTVQFVIDGQVIANWDA